jgi:hypothetical protein
MTSFGVGSPRSARGQVRSHLHHGGLSGAPQRLSYPGTAVLVSNSRLVLYTSLGVVAVILAFIGTVWAMFD